MDTFAARLKYARQRAKLSQEELARKLDISKASISKIEMGLTKEVMMTTLFRIADALMIDPRWLATGSSPIAESSVGLPGDSALIDAYGQLPKELKEPIKDLIEKAATASRQRYWQWIEERDNRPKIDTTTTG